MPDITCQQCHAHNTDQLALVLTLRSKHGCTSIPLVNDVVVLPDFAGKVADIIIECPQCGAIGRQTGYMLRMSQLYPLIVRLDPVLPFHPTIFSPAVMRELTAP